MRREPSLAKLSLWNDRLVRYERAGQSVCDQRRTRMSAEATYVQAVVILALHLSPSGDPFPDPSCSRHDSRWSGSRQGTGTVCVVCIRGA